MELEPFNLLLALVISWVSLAGLMIGLFAWLRTDMKAGEERLRSEIRSGDEQLRSEIKGLEERLNGRIDRLEARIDRLEHRLGAVEHDVARIGGLLEGLRESITDRARSVAAE